MPWDDFIKKVITETVKAPANALGVGQPPAPAPPGPATDLGHVRQDTQATETFLNLLNQLTMESGQPSTLDPFLQTMAAHGENQVQTPRLWYETGFRKPGWSLSTGEEADRQSRQSMNQRPKPPAPRGQVDLGPKPGQMPTVPFPVVGGGTPGSPGFDAGFDRQSRLAQLDATEFLVQSTRPGSGDRWNATELANARKAVQASPLLQAVPSFWSLPPAQQLALIADFRQRESAWVA